MKKFATAVFCLVALLATCVFFVACDKNPQETTYTVTIHQGEGLEDIVWNIDSNIPTLTKDGFIVEGLYLDDDFEEEVSLSTLKRTGLTQNINVYVKWQKNPCSHHIVVDKAILPTCTESGLTEGSHCSICNEVFIAQQEIAALGHDYSSEWTIDVAATCTTDGSKSHHCRLCGDKKDISVMVAEGHKGGKATCTEKAHCDICGKEYGDFGEHCAVVDDAILPTCTENGLTEGSHCIVCDKVFIAQQTVSALGHDFISRITRMPTTEKQGAKLLRCKTCGWKKVELLPTLEGARVVCLTYDMFGIIPDEYSTAGMWIWKNIDKTAELENYFLEHGYETSGRSTSSQAMKQNLTRIEYRESNNDFSVQYFDGNGNCTSVVYHKSNEVPDFAEIFADIEPNDDFRSTKTFIAWGWDCVNNQFVDDLKAKFENAGYILAEEQEDQAFANVTVQVIFGTDNGKPVYGIIVSPSEEDNLSTVQYYYSVPSDKEALFLEKDDFANADIFIAESDNPISLSYYIDDDARLDFVYALAKAGYCVDSENVADMEGSKSTTFTLFSESDGYYFFLSYFDGSGKAWQITFKKNITVYIEARTFSIKYVASEGGQIIGEADQSVQQSQTTQTVKAVAHNGYIFVGWSDGVKTAERSDIAREDMTVTALFEKRNDTILPNGLYIGSGFSEETDVMFFKVDGYEIFVLDDNGNKTDVFYLISQSNDYTIEIIVGEKTYALLQYSKTVYADENMALYRLFEADISTSFDADKVGIYGDRENNAATVTVSADGKITAFGETQNVVKIDGVYVGCVSLSEAGVPDVPDYYKKYYFSEGAIDISFGQDNSVICSYIEGKYKFYKEAQTLPQGSGSRVSAPSGSVGKYKMAVTDRSIEIKEDGTVIITEQGTSSEWHLYEREDTISIIAQRVDSNIELLIEFDGNNVVVYEANQYYKAGMIYRRI